jgi:hypothetical protein
MREEVEGTRKGNGRGLIRLLFQHLCTWIEENNTSVRMDRAPAEIRTQYLPNTSSESYRYANRVNSILFRISASVTSKQQY